MKTILITGGTGLIGKYLSVLLRSKGYKVTVLSRSNSEAPNSYYWNIEGKFIEAEAIKEADYIIHLAGAGIADERWTKNRKKELIDSRVDSTKLLYENVLKLNPHIKGFIAASGIGYYGATTSEKIFTENDEIGTDFIASICKLWENESLKFDAINIRTVILRTGIVLAANGGAYQKMSKPIKLGIGSVLGNGKQYVPWIHIKDLCNMYISAIENENIHGIYNAVSPEHTTNEVLTKNIALSLNKKIILPNTPGFVLKTLLGKMAEILLEGSRVSAEKILATGFNFEYPTLKSALKNLLK
ncbi:TIGR01777 family protein [Lutibacter sp. HS1-25]|uniref:TIGR01777 family oxidoreductase n=1 Tax=Lutibacter sp. HS1-25 TaxID=2485000 RepID=UPI001011DE1D|nr:TIGR01777 family oxidoreductase [Lutibacter sp. HS1-25]RXP63641.1 TIGR01777 family protein [Lutibacter sp. HS1-25]